VDAAAADLASGPTDSEQGGEQKVKGRFRRELAALQQSGSAFEDPPEARRRRQAVNYNEERSPAESEEQRAPLQSPPRTPGAPPTHARTAGTRTQPAHLQVRERDEEEEGADLDAGAEDDEYVPLTPGGGLAPKKSWQRLIPGAPFSRNTAPDAPPLRQQLKDQVLCDLACVYDVCVRAAVPQPAVPGALVKVKVAPANTPAAFAAAVQTLRDTKHFIKDYGGGAPNAGDGQQVVVVEPSGPSGPPAGAGAKAVSRKGARARRVPPPPPQPLWLPGAAAPTAAQVAAAAQDALSSVYVMFRDAKVDGISGVRSGSTVLQATSERRPLVVNLSGYDTSGDWRHAGGPEEWLVVCPCGVRDDDGERMAACDGCAAWAHTRCAGTADCDPVPPLFLCASCCAAGVLPLPADDDDAL